MYTVDGLFLVSALCASGALLFGSLIGRAAGYVAGVRDGRQAEKDDAARVLEQARAQIRLDDAAHAASGDGSTAFDWSEIRALGHRG